MLEKRDSCTKGYVIKSQSYSNNSRKNISYKHSQKWFVNSYFNQVILFLFFVKILESFLHFCCFSIIYNWIFNRNETECIFKFSEFKMLRFSFIFIVRKLGSVMFDRQLLMQSIYQDVCLIFWHLLSFTLTRSQCISKFSKILEIIEAFCLGIKLNKIIFVPRYCPPIKHWYVRIRSLCSEWKVFSS